MFKIMKKLLLIFAVALLTITNVLAQKNTLLWKISGKGLKQDSYLLGTLHIMCPEDFHMPAKVAKAVGNVDQIIFEMNLFDPANTAKMQQAAMTPTKDFFADLGPAKIKTIDSVLTANQMSIKMFDMLSPSTMLSLLALKAFNCPNPMEIKSMEKEVYDLAKNKTISDLETADFQMALMDKIATPQYFYNYLNNYDEGVLLTRTLVDAYKKEDLKTLSVIMTDEKWMPKDQFELMLTNRNKNWVQLLPAKIKDTKTLIAVGAGHLIGDNGIIKLLQNLGYTVTPVN